MRCLYLLSSQMKSKSLYRLTINEQHFLIGQDWKSINKIHSKYSTGISNNKLQMSFSWKWIVSLYLYKCVSRLAQNIDSAQNGQMCVWIITKTLFIFCLHEMKWEMQCWQFYSLDASTLNVICGYLLSAHIFFSSSRSIPSFWFDKTPAFLKCFLSNVPLLFLHYLVCSSHFRYLYLSLWFIFIFIY